jgi:hypothetical protein
MTLYSIIEGMHRKDIYQEKELDLLTAISRRGVTIMVPGVRKAQSTMAQEWMRKRHLGHTHR